MAAQSLASDSVRSQSPPFISDSSGYFCMVQHHRACTSGATSHHAPGTQAMRPDASANKNKPRHSAYSDATIVRLIINRTASECQKVRGWTEDCDRPQRKPADVWEMACDWEHQSVGVSSSPGKLQRSLPAPSPNNKSSPAVGIIFYSFIHSFIYKFIYFTRSLLSPSKPPQQLFSSS